LLLNFQQVFYVDKKLLIAETEGQEHQKRPGFSPDAMAILKTIPVSVTDWHWPYLLTLDA